MDIQEKTTKKMYERGKQIAYQMFIDDAIMAIHTSNNIEEDLKALSNKYELDIDIEKLTEEIRKDITK